MLDPTRDLAGATPEKLARALLRNRHIRPGRERKGEEEAGAQVKRDEEDPR